MPKRNKDLQPFRFLLPFVIVGCLYDLNREGKGCGARPEANPGVGAKIRVLAKSFHIKYCLFYCIVLTAKAKQELLVNMLLLNFLICGKIAGTH